MKHLTSGKTLARNTLWNLIGEGAPLLVGVVAIPILIHALGTARFGILTIVWMLIGYLGFFDLGMGRALTNLVAQKLATGREDALPPLIWTANLLMLALGILAGTLLAAVSHWLVYSILKIPPALQRETLLSLYILSAALPAVITASGFRGVLEAYQRFDAANAVRVPMGVFSFAAPLAVLPFSHSLVPVVLVLAAGRYFGAIFYFAAGFHLLPVMRHPPQWETSAVRPLLSFGGWMTVSNITGPVMVSMDRLFVGAILPIEAVAYYATPSELVTKLLIIPGAAGGALFPTFSATTTNDIAHTRRIYRKSMKTIALTMGPILLAVILAADIGLRVWLGPAFAAHSTPVLQILAIGVFCTSLTQPSFALVQGAGRADWTGKLHLAEVPFYFALFWFLTIHYGIIGTAITWSIRALIDTVVIGWMAERLMHPPASHQGMV